MLVGSVPSQSNDKGEVLRKRGSDTARDRWVRPTQHKRAKRAQSDVENSISITLIHQRPLTAEFV